MANNMPSVPIPFAVGEEVWWVGSGYRKETVICPECCGTKAITMILGNGETVSLDCAMCGPGYNRPTGTIDRTDYRHVPQRIAPTTVRVDGEEITYHTPAPGGGYYVMYIHDMFTDEQECQVRCDELNQKKAMEEERRIISTRNSKRKDMAFSVTYWRGQVKRLEDELHQAKARLSVSKQKEKGDEQEA